MHKERSRWPTVGLSLTIKLSTRSSCYRREDDLLKNCPSIQEVLGLLLKLPYEKVRPGTLIPVAETIKVSTKDLVPPPEEH